MYKPNVIQPQLYFLCQSINQLLEALANVSMLTNLLNSSPWRTAPTACD